MTVSAASALASLAIGQRSLGDPSQLFPLQPALLMGCPVSSTPEMQYPLEIDYAYDKLDRSLFDQPPVAVRQAGQDQRNAGQVADLVFAFIGL